MLDLGTGLACAAVLTLADVGVFDDRRGGWTAAALGGICLLVLALGFAIRALRWADRRPLAPLVLLIVWFSARGIAVATRPTAVDVVAGVLGAAFGLYTIWWLGTGRARRDVAALRGLRGDPEGGAAG